MTDTKPNIEAMIVNMIRRKSGEERLKMGCSMFDMAKKIVIVSLQAHCDDSEMRQNLFLRFYQDSFSKEATGRILAKIR